MLKTHVIFMSYDLRYSPVINPNYMPQIHRVICAGFHKNTEIKIAIL
jgi:hypothetical protein